MAFVHLHCHSEYSLHDSLIKIKELIEKVKLLDQPAVALTDHDVMYGAYEFYEAAVKAGIKPIIGMELSISQKIVRGFDPKNVEYCHLLLLAKNSIGYQNLITLSTYAQIDKNNVTKNLLADHSQGLICASCCIDGEIQKPNFQNGDKNALHRTTGWYYEVFGKENFFFELQNHGANEEVESNKKIHEVCSFFNGRLLATNNVHYLSHNHKDVHDLMLRIFKKSDYTNQKIINLSNEYYLKSTDEMNYLFAEYPSAISNTLLVSEMCDVDLRYKGNKIPAYLSIPEGHTAETLFRSICEQGLIRRYGQIDDDSPIKDRMNYELNTIQQLGMTTLFLIVWDICQFADKENIWWSNRGSVNGSLVAFISGISHVDPITYGLSFERFLNPARIALPDFDLDFEGERLHQITNYISAKYGKDCVARIIGFDRYDSRSAIQLVGKGLRTPHSLIDKALEFIPKTYRTLSIDEALTNDPEFKQFYESNKKVSQLVNCARHFEDTLRAISIHSSGLIISPNPIISDLPLCRPPKGVRNMEIEIMTQYDMVGVEGLGWLKQDFLNLPILSVMHRACNFIKNRYGIEFSLENIPFDDEKGFYLLSNGDTDGIFQVQGSGVKKVLREMKPVSCENIFALISLYRPGPLDFIPVYIRRMHSEENPVYRHPIIYAIYKDTYGIPVYQEQLMQLAMKMAGYVIESDEQIGFSPTDADYFRRDVSKKRNHDKNRMRFISAAIQNGYSPSIAEGVYNDIEGFFRYGFSKAYAVSYGLMTCQTAYLKANFPLEYMAALISESKILNRTGPDYIESAHRMGIKILSPDINLSNNYCTIDYYDNYQNLVNRTNAGVIRLGLNTIKSVGAIQVKFMLDERNRSGDFVDIEDFISRVNIIDKEGLKSLYTNGAFDLLLGKLIDDGNIDEFIDHIHYFEGL